MACNLVIKDKHIQSVLGQSEFESIDSFQEVFYNKFVLNPSAIPVKTAGGITFLRLSQNEDQSISVQLRTNTDLKLENYNLELPEDTVRIEDYTAVIPPTFNENGNPVADLDTFMYLWLGNYYYPDIDKLNNLFEKVIPEVLRSFATKLVYEEQDRLQKKEVIPSESRNFVESLIGEKGLINYYSSILETHHKSDPTFLKNLEKIKEKIAQYTQIIDKFSPIEEKPLEKKYANYTMINTGEDLSPEEAEIAKDLKETEEKPVAEKNTTVVKSFSKPTATFDSDTIDNAEVGKSILMSLVNSDPRQFRAVVSTDDPSFVQNKIVVNNQITSLKTGQVNTKTPSVLIIEVKEGDTWKKVYLKKNTSELVKTSDLAKLDSFSLTTDPAEAYQFSYELEENNEIKTFKSPQLTLRSEQLSAINKDPQKKSSLLDIYNTTKSKGLSLFHSILKGSKAITRNYLSLKVRGFSINDITIKATGPYRGIPQINGEYIDTGVLPEDIKQEVKDLLNFSYPSERDAIEVIKYLNALIGVGDFTPIESTDTTGTNRINITRRTIGFFPDIVNGKYVIKSIVYRYKDEGKFHFNSTKEKLDFLIYGGDSKALIDKSLDAARLQIPKVPFVKGTKEPHEIVGEYPTRYAIKDGALQIVEWPVEEQHEFILENSKTHLTKSGETIANFDQILYVSTLAKESELAKEATEKQPTEQTAPQPSDKEGTLVNLKEVAKGFTDIQKLFKSLFDKKAKDTIIVLKSLPNSRANIKVKNDNSNFTQEELDNEGVKISLKKGQKVNKIIFVDTNSFETSLTGDETQISLTNQAIVEEMIHALTYDKVTSEEVVNSEEYSRIFNAITQLQNSVNLDQLTEEQRKYFEYYVGVKGEEITPTQVLEFLASTQIEVLRSVFESANIDYPKAEYSSLYEYLESLFNSLKKFLSDLLLKDSPSLQERITADTISIILDKVTKKDALVETPVEPVISISDYDVTPPVSEETIKVSSLEPTEELDEVEKIVAEVGSQPETSPVSVDGEKPAAEKGVESAPSTKGKVTVGLSRKFNKKSDTELYTLIDAVKPKFSDLEKTEIAFEDLAVRKSAANHLDMVAAEYLFFEREYSSFIFNKISIQELVELGRDILQRELDDPEISKERKNFVQYLYNNIETIWVENSTLLAIIDKELREEYFPEAESDTTIDGEVKIGQDANDSESNGGDSTSKFEERTEQKKSVLETIGVYAEHFVRMIPRIKTIDGVPQYESFEEDGITFTSPEYLRDSYGNLVPADYTTTWNSIADIVKGSLTVEEMILVLESSFLKVPEVAIFLDRLKKIGTTREDTLLLKNLEKSLQKVFIPTEVMVQEDLGKKIGRHFSIFAQGRLDLINIQNILSSRFREKFSNFIVGLEVDYIKLNEYLKKNTGVSGAERFVSPDNYKQIVDFWVNHGINIPAKLPENLRIKLEKNLATFTFELIAKFNELEKNKISNAVADIKGFDLFSFVAKGNLLNGAAVRSNSFAKNAVLTSLADVLPYSTSNMTKNAEGENQSNLHNFSSFLIYIKYINNLYKNGAAFRDKIVGAIPRLKNPIAKYSWVLDKVRAGATVTPINLSGVQYTNKGTNTINLDLIPYLQFQMQSLLLNNTKENLRAETASTSFGFRIDNSKEKLPISKSVLQSMRPIFESYLRGEIERITKEKKSDYKYFSKYNNKKDKFTFLDSVLSDSTKEKIYEIINNNLDKDDAEIWSLVLPLRQEYVNDFSAYKVKVRANFEKFILEETGLELNIEHHIFNNESLKEHVNTLGFNDAIDMFLMNGVVLGIEEIILFHGEIGQFDKFYKRSKSTISNGTPVVVSKNLRTLLQTTLQGYTFSEIIGGQRPEYYSDPTQLKTSTFSDDLMPLADDQRDNLEKGIENSLKLSSAAFGKPFNKREAEEFANNTVDQYDNANIGDGQGWIHPDAYRMILMGVDSWSPEREEGFIYLAIKEKKRRGFPLEEKDVQKLKEVEDKIKTKGYYFQFPDIKFQYRGGSVLTITVDGKEEDVEAPTAIEVLDKFALAPLFPEFAQNSIAEKMLENMTKNNVAYTKFESATKIGGFEKNNLNDLLSDNFKFKGVHKITTVFLKEQVKTPNKIKEQDSLGTQKRKLLISNLSIDGEFLEEMKPFYNMWKGNQRALADKARKDLYEDLGIDPKAFEDPYAKINIDVNKLVALLRKEVDKRDLPKPLRAFFDKDFEPKDIVFFEQSLSPKIVENMLYSMLKNRIVKAKFPGSQLIQISSSLFNRTTNLNENGRDLEFYRYDEQTGEILPAQAKVTLHGPFLNLLNLPEVKQAGGTLEALNTLLRDPEFRKKHKNVITVVSYRIPTQGYNSMDILEIVEFLPGYLGNTIVPPPQITVKSGTDYDYDKMPTIYPNIDKDGNYISHGNIDKSISQLSKEQYKERLIEVREKIKEAKEDFKEKNKNAIETALTDINVPGEIVEENLDSKKLERLKTLKEHLMNEINSMKQDAEEIKGIIDELKPILNKNVSYKERARQYKEKYGEELDIKKQVEVRKKLYDGLAVLKDSITKNYELLGKLKDIKVEASETLQPLFEERDLLLRSRKIEALYANGLIEAAKGILLHPMNFHRLITPNNVSIVTDKIQSILEKIYGTKNVNPEPVNSDIFDYTTHLKKWLAVKIKDLLGITAVNNTFFSLMQEANFSFNNTININDSSFDFKTPLLTKKERKNARVTNPFLADSGIEKLEILNQFINLFVDASSNDIAGYTNLIQDNVGFVILQNDLGVPFDRTLALIHQPIIYRYNQIVKENTGKGLSKAQAEKIAINDLLYINTSVDGFPIKSSKVWAQIKKKYDENVDLINIEELAKSVVTKDNINNFENNLSQQAALLYYIVGIKQAEALREAQSNVNYDTSPIQSYKRSLVRENIINSIEKTGFVSKSAMWRIKNGVIGHLNIHNELKFLSEKLFPIKADPDFVDFAAPLFEKIPTNKLDEFITTFDNDFLMYVIQNFSINFNQERYEYIKSLMSNGSLMIRWNQLIAKYKLEETRLAQKLYPVTQGYSSANPAIFMGLDNDSEEFNAIEEEIRSYANPVGNSPREIELKAFANDLMDLGFFQTGYNTGRLYMLKVLPAEYTDQFKDAFVNFYNLTQEEKRREYAKFLGAFESQRFDGIAAPLIAPEDQMMMSTYFGTTSDVLINYLEDTSIAQQKGYNSSTTPKRGLTALTEVIAPIETISRLGTSTTFTIFDNTVKKEVTKTGITLSIQGHPDVRIYATKEVSTEKSEVGSTKFNTVTDKVYLNIEHATLGSVVVSDVNAKDLTELLNSFKAKVNKSLSKTAIGISTLKDLGFTITDTSKPQQQQLVAASKKEAVINIYAGTNENAELSNFAIRPFTTNVETPSGEKQFTFQSVEQGFHFYKTIVANRPDIGKKVLETTNGATLKSLTNRSNLPMTSEQIKEWDSTSKSVMLNLMYDSFLENPEAAKKLLNTGNAILTHKFNGKEQDNGRFSEVITIVRGMIREGSYQQQPAPAQQPTVSTAIDFQEDQNTGYAARTKINASADATIAIAYDFNSAGEKLTKSSVLNQNKLYLPVSTDVFSSVSDVNSAAGIIAKELNKLPKNEISLNIAGNGIYTLKGTMTQSAADRFTLELLQKVIEKLNPEKKIVSLRTGGQTGFDEAGAKAGITLGIPTTVLAPKGWKFRNIAGEDISNEQAFKDRFNTSQTPVSTSETQPTKKTLGTLTPAAPVKPGVEELFEENKELAAIGTPIQYSSYLDTIFPDSKVKDIVYHRTFEKFVGDKFNKPSEQSLAKGADDGIYFSKNPNYYTDKGNKIASILNLKVPMKYSHEVFINAIDASGYRKVENSDGFITYTKESRADIDAIKPQFPDIDPNDFSKEELEEIENIYKKELDNWKKLADEEELVFATVFEPEQIHILGSKQDIEGFKEYVSKQTQEETLCRTPSLISKNSIDIPFA